MRQRDDLLNTLKRVASAANDLSVLHNNVIGSAQPEDRPHSAAQVADQTEIEQQVGAVWQRMLRLPSIDVDADFFELGGDSVLALQTLSEIEKRTQIRLSLVELLEGRITVRELATKLRAEAGRINPGAAED